MQVLTLQEISPIEGIILTKLEGYAKAVKTKRLAERLEIERCDLVAQLNKLRAKGLVTYVKHVNGKDDYRGREDLTYGWILVR